MPILLEEPCLFPEDLFEEKESFEEGRACGRWWVLHTRPRAEKALARRLHALGIGFFLPLHQKRWRNRTRTLTSWLPLFPGYVFLRGGDDERAHAIETNCLAGVLPVVDQVRLEVELRRIRQLTGAGVPLESEHDLAPGEPVVIVRGPLAGMTGRVIRRANALRFVVEVQMLRQGVSTDIEQSMLRKLDASLAQRG